MATKGVTEPWVHQQPQQIKKVGHNSHPGTRSSAEPQHLGTNTAKGKRQPGNLRTTRCSGGTSAVSRRAVSAQQWPCSADVADGCCSGGTMGIWTCLSRGRGAFAGHARWPSPAFHQCLAPLPAPGLALTLMVNILLRTPPPPQVPTP